MAETFRFIAIKNWERFQPKDTKNLPWIRDYKDKEFDPEFIKLSVMQRYMMDACCRLRGRYGRNLPNNPRWILSATAIPARERHNAAKAIKQLIAKGFLVFTSDDSATTEIQQRHHSTTTAAPLSYDSSTAAIPLPYHREYLPHSNQQDNPLGKVSKGKERLEKESIPGENPEPSAVEKQHIEMDRHSAATGLGAMVGMSTAGFNFDSLVSAIDQGKRRWPELKNEQVAERIRDLWKEYVSQKTHVKQSLKNWLDSVGRFIDSDDWKTPKPEEFKPQIDWQGGYVGPDGVYVTQSGQRVPGYKCPPKPKAAEA